MVYYNILFQRVLRNFWTVVFVHVVQVDVLEDPIFKNVILLQTVLQEVRAIQ